MAGGQMMDLEAEKAGFDLAAVTRLQQLKTGALISFCLEAGAIMAHVPPEARRGLRGYARDVGLAFTIADALLGVQGDVTRTGKARPTDSGAGKETFVAVVAGERA